MTTQPEALQTPLPDLLDKVPNDLVLGIPGNNRVFPSHTNIPIGKLAQQAAAELRRLHKVEADFHMAYRMKCDAELKKLQAERDALLAAAEKGSEYVLAHINQDLKAERDAAVAALLEYAHHKAWCIDGGCDCGLIAAIDAAKGYK